MNNRRTPFTRLALLLAVPALLVLQACGTTQTPPDEGEPSPEPVTVDSTVPASGGVAGEEYEFNFVYDETVAASTASLQAQAAGDDVLFKWSFGDGNADQAEVTVDDNGKASMKVTHTYDTDGRYGLVFSVEDDDGATLAQSSYVIEIGEVEEGEEELTECGSWQYGAGGGYGVTIDRWDISALPRGTEIDFRFDAYSIPDMFRIDYGGQLVLDTGWRGSSSYEGRPQYPGGIKDVGHGEELAVFTKSSADEFVVTVTGPTSGTAWDYQIRCNLP